jgi:hypothetical protein
MGAGLGYPSAPYGGRFQNPPPRRSSRLVRRPARLEPAVVSRGGVDPALGSSGPEPWHRLRAAVEEQGALLNEALLALAATGSKLHAERRRHAIMAERVEALAAVIVDLSDELDGVQASLSDLAHALVVQRQRGETR